MMDRLTTRAKDQQGNTTHDVWYNPYAIDGVECIFPSSDKEKRALEKLAAYEDTGLTPEEVKTAIRISERIATADYPHNFQREARHIVDYMNWITDVMRDAKAWWTGRIKRN